MNGAELFYDGSGLRIYGHAGWLGSVRLATTPQRGLWGGQAYAPFGYPYAPAASPGLFPIDQFAGATSSIPGGSEDQLRFPYRLYRPTAGRWLSPDPAGLAAVNPANPQTWNRYAYVANQPLAHTDPLGLLEPPSPCGFFGAPCGVGPGPCDPSLYGWDPWPAPGCGSDGYPIGPPFFPIGGGSGGGSGYAGSQAPAPAPGPCTSPLCSPLRQAGPEAAPGTTADAILQAFLAACAGNPVCEIAAGSPNGADPGASDLTNPPKTPKKPKQPFWKNPGCGKAIAEIVGGVAVTAAEGVVVVAFWPEIATAAAEIVAESGPVGVVEVGHVAAAAGGIMLSPLIISADGAAAVMAGACGS